MAGSARSRDRTWLSRSAQNTVLLFVCVARSGQLLIVSLVPTLHPFRMRAEWQLAIARVLSVMRGNSSLGVSPSSFESCVVG